MPSAQHHRNLRQWVIDTDGDGTEVPCEGCGTWLVYHQVTLDRFPIPARWGGTYRRDNVRAMCRPCNNSCEFDLTDEQVLAYAAEHNIAVWRVPSRQSRKRWARRSRERDSATMTQNLGELMKGGQT